MTLWFAVWTDKVAYALDAHPPEIERYVAELVIGKANYAGPFKSAKQALNLATAKMIELRSSMRNKPLDT
jgi:hypothetical protein